MRRRSPRLIRNAGGLAAPELKINKHHKRMTTVEVTAKAAVRWSTLAMIFLPSVTAMPAMAGDDDQPTRQSELREGNSEMGRILFNLGFPGAHGNGRTCADCHVPEKTFQLTPQDAEERFQARQRRRLTNPHADDPLFRSIDANDGVSDFTNLRDIHISKPLPPFAADLPFAPSPLEPRSWAFRVPGQTDPVVVASTDPGQALLTGSLDRLNFFDIPPLYGISKTAPYFHDNSAPSLEAVIRHYQLEFEAVRRVIPEFLLWPLRPDPITDNQFAPLIAYLKKI